MCTVAASGCSFSQRGSHFDAGHYFQSSVHDSLRQFSLRRAAFFGALDDRGLMPIHASDLWTYTFRLKARTKTTTTTTRNWILFREGDKWSLKLDVGDLGGHLETTFRCRSAAWVGFVITRLLLVSVTARWLPFVTK